jgi:hypothetical protein
VRLAARTHALLAPLVWVAAYLTLFSVILPALDFRELWWDSATQLWGTVLVYALVPGYFVYVFVWQWRRAEEAVASLRPLVPAPDSLRSEVLATRWSWLLAGVVLGALYGLSQYGGDLAALDAGASLALDMVLILGNVVTWSVIGWVLGWRLPISVAFSRVGRVVAVDLYDPHALRPFARVAVLDVLVVMGAVALMPLQSLDAEFRLANYVPGLLVGVPAALLLFAVPLWGVHQRIRTVKAARVVDLQRKIHDCDRDDVARLETLVSHRDRVQAVHTWPLDLRLLFRALFYLVLPPLAWVAAALVENLVNRVIG